MTVASEPGTPGTESSPARAGLAGSWMEGWAALASGVADCLVAQMTGRAQPVNIPTWLQVAGLRRPPRWASPHEIVFESPLARLRDFSSRRPRGLVPTLVLPPQAGHDSCIVDFSSEQSQMRTIVASGLERALSLDWVGATWRTADATIDDYLDVIDRAVEHCGGRVNLIGDCQGGWLATIYAALAPERVNTLTIAGAPIDFHAGEPVIRDVMRLVAPLGNLSFYETLVAAGGGVLKGRHMLSGFVMIQPGAEVSRQLELLAHLDDPGYVARYSGFEDWFKHTQDIPGGFFLWVVRHLFEANELVRGELEVRSSKVDLGALQMPLNLLAGQADHITPPDQVFALAHYASTPSEEVRCRLTSGGHLGLFMGHEALAEHWPPLLAQVLGHSRARGSAERERALSPGGPAPQRALSARSSRNPA